MIPVRVTTGYMPRLRRGFAALVVALTFALTVALAFALDAARTTLPRVLRTQQLCGDAPLELAEPRVCLTPLLDDDVGAPWAWACPTLHGGWTCALGGPAAGGAARVCLLPAAGPCGAAMAVRVRRARFDSGRMRALVNARSGARPIADSLSASAVVARDRAAAAHYRPEAEAWAPLSLAAARDAARRYLAFGSALVAENDRRYDAEAAAPPADERFIGCRTGETASTATAFVGHAISAAYDVVTVPLGWAFDALFPTAPAEPPALVW